MQEYDNNLEEMILYAKLDVKFDSDKVKKLRKKNKKLKQAIKALRISRDNLAENYTKLEIKSQRECEYEDSGNNSILTSCGWRVSLNNSYEYCPHCGGRIKEVNNA